MKMQRWLTWTLLLVMVTMTGTLVAHAQTVVRVGHKWDEANKWHIAFEDAKVLFEQRYPDIKIELEGGWTEDKFKIGVAAGTAPDVYVVGDIPSWAVGGFLAPLDELAAKHNIKRADFIPAAWDQAVWDGQIYALPAQVDPNFGLMWNKTLFAEVGLDPEHAPETVSEFDEYFVRLTQYGPDGAARSIGMIPWTLTGGHHNTIYTWGWLFGGEFYDYEAGKATAEHPGVLEALEYLTQYWEQYDQARIDVNSQVPSGLNRFTGGREGMILTTPSNANIVMRDFPHLDFGLTRMFNNPEKGVENATWIGGWMVGLSSSSENKDAAFQWIQFITADNDGVEAFAGSAFWMPGNVKTDYLRSLGAYPEWRPFVEIVVSATKYRPAIPAIETYNAELRRVFPSILRREGSTIGVMEEISKLVDQKVAEMVAQ